MPEQADVTLSTPDERHRVDVPLLWPRASIGSMLIRDAAD